MRKSAPTTGRLRMAVMAFLLLLCVPGVGGARPTSQPPSPSAVASPAPLPVVNLEKEFTAFWKAARHASLEERLRLFADLVERPHQDFYDTMAWHRSHSPQWREKRRAWLTQAFKRFEVHEGRMLESFRTFDAVLAEQVSRFRATFPDAVLDAVVYAAPGVTFNGKANPVGGRLVLGIGIDMTVERGDDVGVLFTHELFHVHHVARLKVGTPQGIGDLPLAFALFMEGLATHVSSLINPDASRAGILMDSALAQVPASEMPRLASRFLQDADLKMATPAGEQASATWFSLRKAGRSPSPVPARCGYLLGWHVVSRLAREYPIQAMVQWSPLQAHLHVKEALTAIAAGQSCKAPGPVHGGLRGSPRGAAQPSSEGAGEPSRRKPSL